MKQIRNYHKAPICSIHMSPLKIVSETQTIHKNNSESYSVSFLKILINQYKINFLTIQIYSPNHKIQYKNLPKPLKNKHYSELTLKLHSRKEIMYKITLKNHSQKTLKYPVKSVLLQDIVPSKLLSHRTHKLISYTSHYFLINFPT